MKFDYSLYPGRERKDREYESNNKKVCITIITAYFNGDKYIDETINSVLNQTFPYWEWIIVNDGSTNKESLEKLKKIEKMDTRIKILNKKNGGLAETRDYGAKKASNESRYLFFLDDDDVIDETYLECAYITMETNTKASWAYTDLVNFGGQEILWTKYFNCEVEKNNNLLVATALIRKADFWEVNGYELREKAVNEDWNLWLKLLAAGKYPVRMSYYGFWYRVKPREESELARSKDNYNRAYEIIKETAKTITKNVEAIQYPKQDYNWDIIKELEIQPIVKKNNGKIHMLMIIPWMTMGGADKFNLDLIKKLPREKYDFTIITTEPNINEWRQQFELYATVYDLTSFLDRKYWASFVNYIIKKENIDIIMNSNSTFGYTAIPYIKASNPNIPIFDYIHMEEWYNRNGGFSRDSSNIEECIEKTLLCNENSKRILNEYFGRNPKTMETVYIGVDAEKFNPKKYNKEEILAKYKIKNDKYIIGFIARIDIQKRPILLMKIIRNLIVERKDIMVLIAGDGPMLPEIKKLAKKYNIEKYIMFLGAVSNTSEIYVISDITLNCSIKEGVALTSYESLSMGVPVVSSNVGGQAELINEDVGKIVPCLQKESEIVNFNYTDVEINNYVLAINDVLNNLEIYKEKARKRIEDNFSIEKIISRMDVIISDLIKNKKVCNGIEKYKDVFKEMITLNFIVHNEEYRWLCNEKNKKLFGEEYQQIETSSENINYHEGFKFKIKRFAIKIHLYEETKIIYEIAKTIAKACIRVCKLVFKLFKQIGKRIRNLFSKRRK